MSPDYAQPGSGLLLFFRVDDLDMALPRARALVARLEEEPHRSVRSLRPDKALELAGRRLGHGKVTDVHCGVSNDEE
jgi:hypothetical protein